MQVKISHQDTKIAKTLQKLRNFEIKSGWFEDAKYADNLPVAGIAAVQDGGATINHPGGQPFYKDKNGELVFVSKDNPRASRMAKTKPHTIVIPPRPFMKPSVEDNKEALMSLTGEAVNLFLSGQISEQQAADMIAETMAGNIRAAIVKVTAPPLKSSTIEAKRSRYKDKKTIGSLTKPLIDSGHMLETVTSKVGLK